jgi:hypothetical protein
MEESIQADNLWYQISRLERSLLRRMVVQWVDDLFQEILTASSSEKLTSPKSLNH